MRLGKTVLLFQAIITLILSIAFFTQILSIDSAKISELKVEMSKGYTFWDADAPKVMVDIKARYSVAAYTLLIVGIFELLLLSRFFS